MTGRPEPILEVQDLVKHFAVKGGRIYAVNGVSFSQARGETIGIVGESGCGKSTLARTVLRLIEPTSGQLVFDGEDLLRLPPRTLRRRRRDMQIIFQDPYASLNPRMSVGDILAEPLRLHGLASGAELRRTIENLLSTVGLSPWWPRRPTGWRSCTPATSSRPARWQTSSPTRSTPTPRDC